MGQLSRRFVSQNEYSRVLLYFLIVQQWSSLRKTYLIS
jgi:hypothetical protein